MVRYEQDRERSFLVSMMNFDLVRGAIGQLPNPLILMR